MNFDNFEGGRLATEHLVQLGHRRIAFIGGAPGHPDSDERHRGYMAALDAGGVTYDPNLIVPGMYHEGSGLEAVEQLLEKKRRFTAIFAANDQMAFGAALGLHRRSLKVPDDVSLVGFDGLISSAFSLPPLTTVTYPSQEMGRLAASAMLQLLRGGKVVAVVPTPQIVVRESTRKLRG